MLVKGQKINDRYEIVKTIGEGGMANVYLANDVILDRKVAIKVLRGDLAGDEKFIRRFQREALSVSNLSHPNIVEVYDVGEEDGNHYIVMEYIEGKTLKKLVQKRGALTLPEIKDIMMQLTDGLAHAHDAYIIHRDIKPQNIMILDNNVVCYLDEGMMGFFDEDFKRNLSELMIVFVDQDVDGVINQLMYMDILDYNIDTKSLRRDLNDLFARYFGVTLNRFDGVLEALLNLMQEYGVILPNEIVTMARGLSMIEAIAQNLDPEIDVFASIKPVASHIAMQKLNPVNFFKNKKNSLIMYEHMLQSLPRILTRVIYKVENEELQLRFEVDITDKVTIVALVSALLIGSSVVSFGPRMFDMPVISLIGYVIAIILSVVGIKKFVLK